MRGNSGLKARNVIARGGTRSVEPRVNPSPKIPEACKAGTSPPSGKVGSEGSVLHFSTFTARITPSAHPTCDRVAVWRWQAWNFNPRFWQGRFSGVASRRLPQLPPDIKRGSPTLSKLLFCRTKSELCQLQHLFLVLLVISHLLLRKNTFQCVEFEANQTFPRLIGLLL